MTDIQMLDASILVNAGEASALSKRDTVGADLFTDRDAAEKATKQCAEEIDALQDRLYAEGSRALLVVLQGMDTSGKDGTVRAVFNKCGPLGVRVTPFGRPTDIELAHDYLWRVHAAAPRRGHIGVFNRSHYEDVLVGRVRQLAPADEIERRYDQINAFEKHLTENGTTVLKFMLNISKDEQRERLRARLADEAKHWKFNAGDLEDRKLWEDYQRAYEIALDRCSTAYAPWRVAPADKKWRRNAVVAHVVHATLTQMNPQYPEPDWKPSDFQIV